MATIKGIIFDMDGTLLDSMPVWLKSGSDFLKRRGYPCDDEADEIAKVASMPELGEAYRERYGVTESWLEIADDINATLEKKYREELQPKEGVLAMLEGYARAGLPMVLATATDRCLAEPALVRCGIAPYLSKIFTTTEVGAGKHNPAIFLAAADFLGLAPPNIAVFEDALYAATTAHKNGFFTVGVYDASFEADQEKLKATADLYVTRYPAPLPL